MKKTKDINFSVAVIAGGQSRRFGSPKAAALLQDQQLIDYAIQLGLSLSDEVFIVAGRSVPFDSHSIQVIKDLIPDCGPLGGLLSALEHSQAPFVCTIPCDMPFLDKTLFDTLLHFVEKQRPVVALSENGIEPLLALWPKSALPTIRNFIDQKRYSLRGPLKKLKALEVNIPAEMNNYRPQVFTNINYPEDLQKSKKNHEK